MSRSFPYLSGTLPASTGLLARYLPRLPGGVASDWLKQRLPSGSWVLDPFGTSPPLVLEMARAGYRVLVSANNPIARHLLELAAAPPSKTDLEVALAELASAHRGDERIEPHIRALYQTECSRCGATVEADYFLWERQAPAPYARYYKCPACQDEGERTITTADVERAAQFSTTGLHRARALERVARRDDPDRIHAEEALEVYLPRAVYALFTLINKLDGMTLSPTRRNHLLALLLHACDQANTLWHHPYEKERERPLQLVMPHRFRENNVWMALEKGIELWEKPPDPFPLVHWPELPPDAGEKTRYGICLYEGRLRDLADHLQDIPVGAVLATLPRPNQAFWTLSALWAGWLWGREAVGPFKSVLRRRRYDWGWHTAALSAIFRHLSPLLTVGTPFLGLITEAEPGFISSAVIAAQDAGFALEGIGLRMEEEQAQITWQRATDTKDEPILMENARPVALQEALDYLRERGQPCHYLLVKSAALSALADAHAFHLIPKTEWATSQTDNPAAEMAEPSPSQNFSQVQGLFKEIFSYRYGFRRYEGSEQSLEVGQWWLREDKEGEGQLNAPLADRVEIALINYLQEHPGCQLAEIDRALCESFPGLHTPELELVKVCLDSYGEHNDSGQWTLRPQEQPAIRHADLDDMRLLVRQLGDRLGFTTTHYPESQEVFLPGMLPFYWQTEEGEVQYVFYILASATLGEIVAGKNIRISPIQREPGSERMIIVLPGSRSNLVAYKLQHDPHLKQEISRGWHLLKYRHLRLLVENLLLTPENLEEQMDLDPLTYSASQIRML